MTYFPILQKCPLFFHILPEQYQNVLACCKAYQKHYKKGSIIAHYEDHVKAAGIVISGSIHILKHDYLGNNTILTPVFSGELFAETYAFANLPLQVEVQCIEDADILWIPVAQLYQPCEHRCDFHKQLIENMLQIMAMKNLQLTQKMEYLAKKTIKEKVLSYLYQQASISKQTSFTIPFNRQQLADYLCVDRSALSYVLSELQKEGILTYHKNQFSIKKST